MSGLSKTRGGKDVGHAFGRHGARDDLAHGKIKLLLRTRPRTPTASRARTRTDWKNPNVVADTHGLRVRHG